MKHICIEGGDSLGKNTLIEGICKHLNYDNLIIRHFGKPPKGMSPKETLDFQFDVFYKEIVEVRDHFQENIEGDVWGYYPNTLIWNRSYLGEYVYSQMFRGIPKQEIKQKIKIYEERNFNHLYPDVYLITLTASPIFFLSKEDGDSFSQNLEQKTRELELFKEVHHLSIIPHKKLVKVDFEGHFRDKDKILESVIQFIDGKE